MKQKYAVVTGGTKGIGRAVSEKLLKNGYRVFAVYASDDAAAEKFMEDSFSYKDRISLIKCDLSTRENADLLIKTVLKSTGCLDCIILNAGATDRTPFDEITYEKWEYVVMYRFILFMNLNRILQKKRDVLFLSVQYAAYILIRYLPLMV